MSIAFSTLNHSMRVPLAAEIHSRPFLKLDAPESISHLAIYRGSDGGPPQSNAQFQLAMLADLCRHFGVAPPAQGSNYFFHDFGRFRLKWECHTEFATYTFASHPPDTALGLFAEMPSAHLPQQWLLSMKGRLMVAAHVALVCKGGELDELLRDFESNRMVGANVMQGGELWTDFAIHPDGFSRFVIRDVAMRAQQAGRLVQRVLEIETYRMMALLGLPTAQQAGSALNVIEAELASLATAMVATDAARRRKASCRMVALNRPCSTRSRGWRRGWKSCPSVAATAFLLPRPTSSWSTRESRNCASCASKACRWSANSWRDAWRRRCTLARRWRRARTRWASASLTPTTCCAPASASCRKCRTARSCNR
jgi:uncharacterized membrane-anchored protein